jgi:hypothetical protein
MLMLDTNNVQTPAPGFSLVLCGGHFSGIVLTVSARKKGKQLNGFLH